MVGRSLIPCFSNHPLVIYRFYTKHKVLKLSGGGGGVVIYLQMWHLILKRSFWKSHKMVPNLSNGDVIFFFVWVGVGGGQATSPP